MSSYQRMGRATLALAADSGHITVVKLLLNAGCTINVRDSKEVTRFRLCARNGNTEIVDILLTNGAGKGAANWVYPELLALAAQGEYLQTVQRLLDHGAQPHIQLLLRSANCRNTDIVALWLRLLDFPNSTKSERGCEFADSRRDGLTLSSEPPQVANRRWSFGAPLAWATEHGRVDVVRCLLSHVPDPDGKRNHKYEKPVKNPLICAVRGGYAEVVSLLLEHGAGIPEMDEEDRILSLAIPHEDIFKILPNKGARFRPRERKEDIRIPLSNNVIRACQAGELQMLFDKGLDFNEPTFCSPNCTLLDLISQSNKAVLNTFLQNGYNPQPGSAYDEQDLKWAASKGNIALVRLVISRGLNLSNTLTPAANILTYAASADNHETAAAILDILLQAGLDFEATNTHGQTALLQTINNEFN
ncbi:ankyrin repeat-containing domain protein [Aspergillus spectabilis]